MAVRRNLTRHPCTVCIIRTRKWPSDHQKWHFQKITLKSVINKISWLICSQTEKSPLPLCVELQSGFSVTFRILTFFAPIVISYEKSKKYLVCNSGILLPYRCSWEKSEIAVCGYSIEVSSKFMKLRKSYNIHVLLKKNFWAANQNRTFISVCGGPYLA